MFLETVSLVLKHSDISTAPNTNPPSSSVGTWSNGKQKTTWRFNMRNLLGNKMYDENELFTIRLNQLSYALANFPLSVQDQQVIVTMSGLNFINSTYNVATGNNTNKHELVIINLSTAGAGVENYSPNVSMCHFKKSQENIELTMELIRTIDGQAGQFGIDFYPHMVYSFDIFAIKK